MTATAEQLALVASLLPSAAYQTEDEGGYGWTDDFVQNLMDTRNLSPTEAVRFFWLQRVNETSEYLDAGKPLTQIHKQARDMLDYWDMVLKVSKNATGPSDTPVRVPISFGEIEGPWDA